MSAWRAACASSPAPLPPTRIGSRSCRARFVDAAREREVGAVVVDRLAVQQAADDLDHVGQQRLAFGRCRERCPGGGELGRCVPGAEPELDATTAEVVERGHLAGQQQGVVEAGVEHERADADALRRRCRGRQAEQRAPIAAHVVGDEDDVVAERLRLTGRAGGRSRVGEAQLERRRASRIRSRQPSCRRWRTPT